jgi:hypothetical protein
VWGFPESCLWPLGFDIKLVRVGRADGNSKRCRKPSHEHTFIEDMLYSRLCGSVDMSTCIYLDDESFRVRSYLDLAAPGLYRLESYHVRPYDGKTWNLDRMALEETVEELAGRAQQLALRLRSLRPGNRVRATAEALKLIELLRSALDAARAHRGDIEKLKLGAEIESKLRGALEEVRSRLEEVADGISRRRPTHRVK